MVRILLADDHPLLRAGIRALLEREADLEVVGEAENGQEAIALAREHRPDLVVMDIQMPELNGMSATSEIRALLPETKVIALSSFGERSFVQAMLKAGASAYLLKDDAGERLIEAIRTVMAGGSSLSPEIQTTLIADYRERLAEHDAGPAAGLSDREREILQLIAAGKENKEIAHALHLSRKTVDSHRRNIMEKLNLHSVAELTRFAIREGLSPL